jgi:hypothetical protein
MRPFYLILILALICISLPKKTRGQGESRKFTLLITNEKKEPLTGADVQLESNDGSILAGKTNKDGLIDFQIKDWRDYTSGRAIIKKGSNRFESPVYLNYRLNRLTIEVPEDMVIMVDDLDDWKKEDQKEPTIDNPAADPRLLLKAQFPVLPMEYGPYTTECDPNPLATVPLFDYTSVESEKTLADAVAGACTEAASDAVNSLVDLTYTMAAIKSKLEAIWRDALAKRSFRPGYTAIKSMIDTDGPTTRAAISDATEKLKTIYEEMEKLAAGPELYVATCVWDGIKKYFVPADILKMKKSTENFGKAKEALGKKIIELDVRSRSAEPYSVNDRSLFTDWGEVTENLEKTKDGLSVLVSYARSPRKMLTSYESQAQYALQQAEGMLNTVNNDCRIAELDKQLKTGLEMMKSLLATKRKFAAQMHKEEGKTKDRINALAGNKPWYPFGYETKPIPRNAMAPLIGIETQWPQFVAYHNERIEADNESKRLEAFLLRIAAVCQQVTPIASALNQKVALYEQLYLSGCEKADNCDFPNAEQIVSQLRTAERSACGHFYPHPFGFLKSENLAKRILREREHCKTGYSGGIPVEIKECEGGICGTWKLEGTNRYVANWDNGAKAILNIEKFGDGQVIISRNDTKGSVTEGFHAEYTGTITGQEVKDGKVTFQWNGSTWYGTWTAKW